MSKILPTPDLGIRQSSLAQHCLHTLVVHRDEISFLPDWFIFRVSFSNLLLVLKQLFGCFQLLVVIFSKILVLNQLFGCLLLAKLIFTLDPALF